MRVLKRGCTGNDVRYLQYKLGVSADGSFGAATEKALRVQQKKLGLSADGSCGPATRKAMGLADFIVWVFDPIVDKIWFAGEKYEKQPKKLRTLKEWAQIENADYTWNLAFFNMRRGQDKYGEQYGRTIQYVRGKGYDIGYGGTVDKLTINANNICSGYKVAVAGGNSKLVSITGKRARNANGLLADGRYFHVQSVTKATEKEIRDYMVRNYKVQTMLIQDSGGSTGFYDRSRNVLLAGEQEGRNGRAVATVVCVRKGTK